MKLRLGLLSGPLVRRQFGVGLDEARRLRDEGRQEDAIAIYDELLAGPLASQATEEQAALALVAKAHAQYKLDRDQDAATTYRAVVERFGESTNEKTRWRVGQAMAGLGAALYSLHELERSVDMFDRFLESFGARSQSGYATLIVGSLNCQGLALLGLGRQEQALEVFRAVIARTEEGKGSDMRDGYAAAVAASSRIIAELGPPEEALDQLRRGISILERQPESAGRDEAIGFLRGDEGVLLARLGRTDEAAAVFDRVVDDLGGSTDTDPVGLAATALHNKALGLLRTGRPEEALRTWRLELEWLAGRVEATADPRFQALLADVYVGMGRALADLGRHKEALVEYRRVTRRYAKDTEPAFRRAVLLAYDGIGWLAYEGGRYQEAERALTRAIAIYQAHPDPEVEEDVAHAQTALGLTLMDTGRVDEALAVFDKAIDEFGESDDPDIRAALAWAFVRKGSILRDRGRLDEARACVRRAKRDGNRSNSELQEEIAQQLDLLRSARGAKGSA